MQIPANAETKNITVQGVKLTVPQPYTEGHQLTENEAAALNQVLSENLRNNFAAQIRRAKDEAEKAGEKYQPDAEALQTEMDQYVAEYEFGVKRTGAASTAHLDPVEKEMHTLARNAIKQAIMAKGVKLKDVPKEKVESLVEQYLAQYGDTVRKNAEAIVQSREAVAAAGIGSEELAI